ncbi:polysaccharide deacetylase family protein [Endozoicomonas euniceicola]|uniref:Polysaccharide deacetylase family protein n=1 Tax=Endozoicomonas euniceicola TaxID=1234143 RepID=A0ABY6GS68_9GAMM|nr:polysaccharide deacetylase family protein [Endozoicomonas euniceicola]UYM15264.1 polysaccharide deacetylase family protein [Endozoicomonas euniceicola]
MTDQSTPYPRNWTGYAGQPPAIRLPGNQRLAINLILNLEEGSERNILDGDECSEHYLSGFPGLPARAGSRHPSSESLFAYGSRAGFWRLYRLFEEYRVPVTVFACGQALERNPAIASTLGQSNHEIAGHGWRWIDYEHFSREDEQEHLLRTLDTIHQSTGKLVRGWYTGRKSLHTRELVIEAGLEWDSDDYSDDYPWWQGGHLVIPYTLLNNDCLYGSSSGWVTPSHFFEHLKNTFDCLYREGKSQPTLMTVGLHGRLSGHPGRSEAIKMFLEYTSSYPDVWFTTRSGIADLWIQQFQQKTL